MRLREPARSIWQKHRHALDSDDTRPWERSGGLLGTARRKG